MSWSWWTSGPPGAPRAGASPPIFAAVAAEHPEVLFASVDTDSEPGLAAAANIRALPTLMLFRDGLLVQTHQGGLRASRLTRMLETVRAQDMGSVGAPAPEAGQG